MYFSNYKYERNEPKKTGNKKCEHFTVSVWWRFLQGTKKYNEEYQHITYYRHKLSKIFITMKKVNHLNTHTNGNILVGILNYSYTSIAMYKVYKDRHTQVNMVRSII